MTKDNFNVDSWNRTRTSGSSGRRSTSELNPRIVLNATGGNRTRDLPADNRSLCHSATVTFQARFQRRVEESNLRRPLWPLPASNRLHYRSANPPTLVVQRRVRDSNPHRLAPCPFSRRVP